MWGILGMQDGMHRADMEKLETTVNTKLADMKANFEEENNKYKNLVNILLNYIEKITGEPVNLQEILHTEEIEKTDDFFEKKFTTDFDETPTTLSFSVVDQNCITFPATYNEWRSIDSLVNNICKYLPTLNFHMKDGLFDKAKCVVKRETTNEFGKKIYIDLTADQINYKYNTSKMIIRSRYRNNIYIFSSPTGFMTIKNMIEVLSTMEKNERNYLLSHKDDLPDGMLNHLKNLKIIGMKQQFEYSHEYVPFGFFWS